MKDDFKQPPTTAPRINPEHRTAAELSNEPLETIDQDTVDATILFFVMLKSHTAIPPEIIDMILIPLREMQSLLLAPVEAHDPSLAPQLKIANQEAISNRKKLVREQMSFLLHQNSLWASCKEQRVTLTDLLKAWL